MKKKRSTTRTRGTAQRRPMTMMAAVTAALVATSPMIPGGTTTASGAAITQTRAMTREGDVGRRSDFPNSPPASSPSNDKVAVMASSFVSVAGDDARRRSMTPPNLRLAPLRTRTATTTRPAGPAASGHFLSIRMNHHHAPRVAGQGYRHRHPATAVFAGSRVVDDEDANVEDVDGGDRPQQGNVSGDDWPTSTTTSLSLDVDVIGDAFVDLLCFLNGHSDGDGGAGGGGGLLLPVEAGGDLLLDGPIVPMAGGSGINTATHLRSVLDMMTPGGTEVGVELQTVLNPEDQYGKILTDHADRMGFNVVNRRRPPTKAGRGSSGGSTGHCVVIVTGGNGGGGGGGSMERTFLTHRGCVDDFAAEDVDVGSLIDPFGSGNGGQTRGQHHHRHIHVAGYYSMPEFWHGRLGDVLRSVRDGRKGGGANDEKVAGDESVTETATTMTTTTVSLVPQYDATQEWDGGILDLLLGVEGCVDYLICSEAEVRSITRCHRCTNAPSGEGRSDDEEEGGELSDVAEALHCLGRRRGSGRPPGSSSSSVSSSSGASASVPELTTIVTRGERGAVVIRGGRVVASQPAHRVEEPVDPTGAGDAFAAGFLCGVLRHHSSAGSFPVSAVPFAAGEAVSSRGRVGIDEAMDDSANSDSDDHLLDGDLDAIREGLRWGCAVGTASVLNPGASTPSRWELIDKFLSR